MNEIYDNDFKNFFKYTKEIKELPPLPKNFDTKHLQDFINEFERQQQENQQLKEKINQYENPEDLTLFYMWIDEKAKDKMKELQQRINEALEYIKYCQTSDDDIYPVIEAEKMIEILKGEEND